MSETALLREFSRTLLSQQFEMLSDCELLERFRSSRDGDAFAALLRRHAGLVHGVCRRVLRDSHLADDVFQATFLLLARKAASLRQSELVANWLFGVARRLSLKVQSKREHTAKCERQAASLKLEVQSMPQWDDLLGLLDEELERLPACYRRPLMACYLREMTQDEAASQLGLSLRTLRRRLAEGRELLRQRLAARGAGLSIVLGAAAASSGKVDASLIDSTMTTIFATSLTPAATSVVAMATQTVTAFKIRIGMFVVLTLSLLIGAMAGWTEPQLPAKQAHPKPDPPAVERRDRQNDPLPPGALVRLGTLSLQHGGEVERLLFSPDGKTLLSIGDGLIHRWQVDTGNEVEHFDFRESGRKIMQSALSPDGTVAIVSYADELYVPRTVEVFETASHRRIREFALPPGATHTIDMNGRLIIADRKKIDLWNANADRIELTVPFEKGYYDNLRMSSANGKLIVCSSKYSIHVFDVKSGTEIRSFGGGVDGTLQAHWVTPDGKWLLTRGYTLGEIKPSGEKDPSGRSLSSQAVITDPLVRVWDLEKGALAGELNSKTFTTMVASISPDSRTALVVSTNEKFKNTVERWDLATQKLLATWPEGLASCERLRLSPDEKLLAVASRDGKVYVYDVTTRKDLHPVEFHEAKIWLGSFSRDGKSVRTFGQDNVMIDWNAHDGSVNRRSRKSEPGGGVFNYSADGRFRARLDPSRNGRITIWDLDKDQLVHDFGPYRPYRTIAISNDGKYFTLVSKIEQKQVLQHWEIESGRLVNQFEVEAPDDDGTKAPRGHFQLGAWSLPNSQLFLVCGPEVRNYNCESGRQSSHWTLPDLNQSTSRVYRHRWIIPSPDGRFVADALTGSRNVRIHHLDTGTMSRQLEASEPVKALRFSSEGKLLAAVVGDQSESIIIWDVASGRKKREFNNCGRGDISLLAFSPDGKKLLTRSDDCCALIWEIEP